MTRRHTASAFAFVLAVAAAGAAGATPAAVPAAAAAESGEGACTDPGGVTVVVDFQRLGGGVHVRCAPGPVASGFDALGRAGIAYRTALRQPGFLCRIADRPADDPCVDASPAHAYWSYWLAPRGGAWCYSNLGAGNRVPPPGTVEGWSFALGATAASVPPPSLAPPPPLPGTTPTPLPAGHCTTPAASTGATGTPPSSAPSGPDPTPGSAGPPPAADPGAGGAAPDEPAVRAGTEPEGSAPAAGSVAPTAGASAAGPTTSRREPTSEQGGDAARASRTPGAAPAVDLGAEGATGSPLGAAAGAALVAAVGGAALAATRSRRRRAQAGASGHPAGEP